MARATAANAQRGPLFWVLTSLAVLVALVGLVSVAFDLLFPLKTNADMLRLMLSTNPDLVIVAESDDGFLVRSKSTGVYTLRRLDPGTKTISISPAPALEETK